MSYQVEYQSLPQQDLHNTQANNLHQVSDIQNYVDIQSLERMKTQNTIEQTNLKVDPESKKKVKKQRGHWSNEEHYKFLQFVRLHHDLFKTTVHKKLNRVFKMMAEEIQTRNACQCRSHFSKFNPFIETTILRRKLCNDEQVYEKMFENKNKLDVNIYQQLKYIKFTYVITSLQDGIICCSYRSFEPQVKVNSKCQQSKALPDDFASQILNNDIVLVLSNYSNNEALKNLIQLYMQGVEFYKECEDKAHEYFEIKLKNIFTNPSILQPSEQAKQSTPPEKKKIEVPKINVVQPSYSFMNKPKTSKKPDNNILSFSFQEPVVDKFFQQSQQLKLYHSGEEEEEENTHQKNIIEQEKEEKIKEIQNQVIEEQIIIQTEGRAKEIASQFKKQERRISQQIEAGMSAQESSIQKRKEMRKLRSQFSLHNINKTQSTPTMKQYDQHKTPQDDPNCIPEETNEIGSGKLSSNKKHIEVNQFQFNDECK
ncbi:unnamed protein product (macronuclear) [Paramecium tetraurelia]|uniref:Uncharacterized protein n=1 Tax=Paramecium tetraurelia TaxID=5888 RepID=A0BLF4_PARTE|nr:uncharacterized protein GSPATT00030004001 [Paramecium tetraurelia]CAK59371.1 unnamed protein product [Paramecium tetraurelia]|eukprot:XP_001426769.1 hypothetical protein (macronuclear) [Paramecium tetraurelia strain d4-2]